MKLIDLKIGNDPNYYMCFTGRLLIDRTYRFAYHNVMSRGVLIKRCEKILLMKKILHMKLKENGM